MGKTADLTVVQKTIIDTLHKKGKSQTIIAKEAGCSQSAVSALSFKMLICTKILAIEPLSYEIKIRIR